MNIKEWQTSCKENWFSVDHKYDIASRQIQKSLKYNPDPNATVRHHLRDTEEQRKYNDEHYELWGFEIDENGNEHFEYGKYVIFVTGEEHRAIHALSEETRKKMSEAQKGEKNNMYGKRHSDATKQKMSESHMRENMSDEYRKSLSEGVKRSMTEERRKQISERNKNRSEEERLNLSNAAKKRWRSKEYRDNQANSKFIWSDEKRKEFGETRKGENNPMYGVHPSAETINKRRESLKITWDDNKRLALSTKVKERFSGVSNAYKKYKADGGELTWNEFQKIYKSLE